MKKMTFNEPTKALMSRLIAAGGFPYVVGGAVRDFVRVGKHYNDIDIEVFGISSDDLALALEDLNPDNVGVSFSVWKVKIDGQEFDVSLPRTEVKVGTGHLGFVTTEVPHATVREAAARRDFTMNAMMAAPDGTIVDPFSGIKDIEDRILRHVGHAFAEDPLRVLRGAQFAARFKMTMHPATVHMCHMLISEFGTISKERIWHEFEKMLRVSGSCFGFDVLNQTAWSFHFPNFAALFDPLVGYHVSEHGSIEMKLALCLREHSIGSLKSAMREIGVPHSIQKGVVALHRANEIYEAYTGKVAQLARLLDRVGMSISALENFRRLNYRLDPLPREVTVQASAHKVVRGPLKNLVTGDTLIEMGFSPSPIFGAVIKEMEELQDCDFLVDDDNLKEIVFRCVLKHLPPPSDGLLRFTAPRKPEWDVT